jgi:EmrB/QacA subfamily drug resistance transporter
MATTSTYDNAPSTTAITLPFAAIVLAMLPAVLDQTILATALPTIAIDLGRLSDVSWVVSAYVVAAAATTPMWGKLGDRHGRKLLLEIALAMFLGASALCGVAQDITVLVAARAVQGVAAGGLMTLAMATVGDLVSPRERGRYQGYIMAAFAVATVVGPLLGGVLVEHASWRWVFYVNLPLGLVALAGLHLRLPAADADPSGRRFDAAGAALLAGATSALMLACIWGGDRFAWGSATILALIAAAVLLGGGLVLRERRAADPIVPFALLRTRTVAVASAGLFLATAALFSITVFVPLFLQTTTGASPTQAGLLLVPAMLGITLSTTLSGRSIARTGRYKRFPLAGLALMTAALALLAALAGEPSRTTTGVALALFGLGFGMVGQVLIVAVQNSVERRELGVATAATGFFRALGGAVGAAVLGAVFAGAVGPAARADVIDAVQTVFLVAAPLAALAFVVVLALEEVPLRGPEQPAPKPSLRSEILLRTEQTDGEVAIVEITVPAGWGGPPLHHHDFDEAFYVLAGELTFQVGDELVTAGPGAVAFAPRGVHHTLANLSDAEARYLLICTPGGFERRFDPAASEPYPETTVVGPQIAPTGARGTLPVPDGRPKVLLRSEQSDGRVSVVESFVPTDAKGPFLHTHDFDEAFYIVDGELTFQVEDRLITVRRGEIAFAPRGVPHTFTNRSGEPARSLIVCTPAGFERYFARMAAERAGVEAPAWALQPIPDVTRVGPQIADEPMTFARRGSSTPDDDER